MDKKNKVAIITGAGRGIGRGIAIQLARAGWSIVINDIGNPDPPAETLELVRQEGSDGIVVIANITLAADRQRIVDETIRQFWPNGSTGQQCRDRTTCSHGYA